MKNKFVFLVLFSFALVACENMMLPDMNGNSNANPLLQKMDKMSNEMDKLMMTKDPDHNFAMMMKSHHKGAIDMANYELSHGSDDKY